MTKIELDNLKGEQTLVEFSTLVTIFLVSVCWLGILMYGRKILARFIILSFFSGVLWVVIDRIGWYNYPMYSQFFYVYGPEIGGGWVGAFIPTTFTLVIGFFYLLLTIERDINDYHGSTRDQETQPEDDTNVSVDVS